MDTDMYCPSCDASWSGMWKWRCPFCGDLGNPGRLPDPCAPPSAAPRS